MRFRKNARLDASARCAMCAGARRWPRFARREGRARCGRRDRRHHPVVLVLLLNGGGGGGTNLLDLGAGSAAGPTRARICRAECQTGEDANQRQDCRIVAVVNSVQDYWARHDPRLPARRPTTFFTGQVNTGLRYGVVGGRTVLLPARSRGVRRPRLLRRARDAVRRARWSVRGGVRDRARVRPPRAEPARRRASRRRTVPPVRRRRRCGSSCRPTATRACGRRTPSTPSSSSSSRTTTSRAGSTPPPRSATIASSSRRRDRWTRGVDARFVGAAATLVHDRIQLRRSRPTATRSSVLVVTGFGDSGDRCRSPLCRQNLSESVEVAGAEAVGEADRQAGDAAGDEVDHALMAFEHAAHPQRG